MAAELKGSLKLDRVIGIRSDKMQNATPIQDLVKTDKTFKPAAISKKTVANVTTDGLKK